MHESLGSQFFSINLDVGVRCSELPVIPFWFQAVVWPPPLQRGSQRTSSMEWVLDATSGLGRAHPPPTLALNAKPMGLALGPRPPSPSTLAIMLSVLYALLHVLSFNRHHIPVQQGLPSYPFYWWENCGTKKLSDQSHKTGTWRAWVSNPTFLIPETFLPTPLLNVNLWNICVAYWNKRQWTHCIKGHELQCSKGWEKTDKASQSTPHLHCLANTHILWLFPEDSGRISSGGTQELWFHSSLRMILRVWQVWEAWV